MTDSENSTPTVDPTVDPTPTATENPTVDSASVPDAATLPFQTVPNASATLPSPTMPEAVAPPAGSSTTPRRNPLFGTILWGTLALAFAGFMVFRTLVPGSMDPSLWLLGGVIATGLVLVVAGVAAAMRHPS